MATTVMIKAKSMTGYTLKGLDGDFGRVRELYFDDQHWAVRYLVAETGTWLTGRQVLISPYSIEAIDHKSRYVTVRLTKKQIEESPPLATDLPVSRQFESLYHTYYHWPLYWSGPYLWGTHRTPDEGPVEEKAVNSTGKDWDPHLRSTIAVNEYTIQATDGEIGQVEDFIIEEATWAIRYMVVDTNNWWPGTQVLIATHWIDTVSWDLGKVFVKLTRSAIRHSPEYSPAAMVTRAYEAELHGHFNRQGYWLEAPASPGPHQ